jgi:hypothetical protein
VNFTFLCFLFDDPASIRYQQILSCRQLVTMPVDISGLQKSENPRAFSTTGGSISSGARAREGKSRNVFLKNGFTHDSSLQCFLKPIAPSS